jgi:hypothetical protein
VTVYGCLTVLPADVPDMNGTAGSCAGHIAFRASSGLRFGLCGYARRRDVHPTLAENYKNYVVVLGFGAV